MTTRDHDFHGVTVARVDTETADAGSIVLDVPDDRRELFTYSAGQFCTFRVPVNGTSEYRCYSMASTPAVDDEFYVTVKRVPGGMVSNWLLDNVSAGDVVDVSAPAGVFELAADETEFVAFAAGSGITPVFSLMKQALHETDRPVRLLYANRDQDSVIFREQLDDLRSAFASRLQVVDHFDVDAGFVDAVEVKDFLGDGVSPDAGFYLCGPTPFMDLVETALLDAGVAPERIHLERFTPAEELEADIDESTTDCRVTIELDGRTDSGDHHPGATILQTARQLGMSPPFSCESGNCATCMARLLEGSVEMFVNNALDDDEVEEGFILTCQSVPTSAEVSVRYGFE